MAAPRQITGAGLLLLLLIVHEVSTGGQQISVSLNAKWNSTPLMMEASEFLASEDHDLFWRFVNMIADLPYDNYEDQHDESMYDMVLKFAGRLLSPLQIYLLKFSLSMRAYSPTVQMHYQVALDKQAPENCELFVDVNNMITCEMGAFKAMLSLAKKQNKPSILKNDHHYPGSQNHDVTAILYADFTSKGFKDYHNELKKLAEDGEVNYILRHFVKNPVNKKVRLSGYGVELAIKNTEYKAKDDTKVEGEDSKGTKEKVDDEVEGFNFSKLKQLHPDLTDKLDEFRGHLVESAKEIPPLKVWQLQDLSFQAAQQVLSASPEDAMKVLRDISQNFPTKMRKVVKTTVKEAMRQEVKKNQRMLQEKFDMYPGDSALFINGLQADLDIYDVFTLLGTLQSEAKLLEGLSTLGIKGDQANNMLKLNTKQSESNYALDIRDKAVQWLNNLEKDKRYSGWPSSVQELLRPTFPGMLRHIRKNFFSLIFMIDPGDVANKELLKMAEAFYVHNAPVRVGLLLLSSRDKAVNCKNDPSAAFFCAFEYIRQTTKKPYKGLSFITEVYERVGDDKLTAHFIMEEFESEFPDASVKDVFGEKSKYAEARKDAAEFHQKTGLGAAPQVLLNGIPLSKSDLDSDNFEEAVVTMILKQTQDLQRAVYNGELSDSTNIMDYVMTKPNVMPRLNSRILSEEGQYLDMTKTGASVSVKNAEAFRSLPPADMTGAMISTLKYMTKKEEDKLRPITHWVISDLDTKQGRELLYAAIKHLKHSQDGRVGIIHNPASVAEETDKEAHYISRATQVAMETLSSGMSKTFITKLMKEENVEELIAGTKMLSDFEVHNMDTRSYERSLAGKTNEFLKVHAVFCEKALGFKPGERGVISNGRILGPLKSDEQFITEDFNLLEKQMIKGAASEIEKEVLAMALENEEGSDLVMRVAGLLMSVPHKETRKDVEFKAQEHSVVKIPPKKDGPSYDVVAILDPSTRAAQKYTPLIMVLQQVVNVNVKVFMNCREKLSEMPLKSFYRYVLEPEVTFAVDSSLASGPTAIFTDLPRKSLLTMNLDPPESWLVESVNAVYDLDNIVMEEVEGNLNAEFELEYLLLEGHCFDANSGQPPRGLQFVLGTSTKRAVVDTIVMANLGYFQLKATPGAWNLNLRHGRSSEIYEIASHEFTDSPADSQNVVVVINSFKSKIIKVKVNKKKGKEREDLLGESQETGGLWDSISSLQLMDMFGDTKLSGGTDKADDKDQTLNIFSLASGHLYERFLRIMILSVLKHTQSKVKFWFLKNYLSPTFKDFIPHMAKEYNFEYELVQYKWPRWLHQQTEKQRIMWGYKILFLDVLFPLDVQKIIFVDADQIVRTDLQELNDFDLEGAPYGYTPFCDSRTEMDGFRFWKSGYWASHLGSRRYHISALYVVDLKKFRKIAAGDRLRGQYQGLSQDPNSLSNLDQDLPNNMIHQVAIKSLPQEWLWCETWCSDGEKSRAKTIDLCNNPQTKEPKLQAAMRIVPEWKDYDSEVKRLWEQIYKKNGRSDAAKTEPVKDEL